VRNQSSPGLSRRSDRRTVSVCSRIHSRWSDSSAGRAAAECGSAICTRFNPDVERLHEGRAPPAVLGEGGHWLGHMGNEDDGLGYQWVAATASIARRPAEVGKDGRPLTPFIEKEGRNASPSTRQGPAPAAGSRPACRPSPLDDVSASCSAVVGVMGKLLRSDMDEALPLKHLEPTIIRSRCARRRRRGSTSCWPTRPASCSKR
jgi:hypothetical protein